MPWWIPLAASAAAGAASQLIGGKDRAPALPGVAEDTALAGRVRGFITRALPGLNATPYAGIQGRLDVQTADAYKRATAAENQRAASRGAYGGNGNVRNRAEITRAENAAYTDNAVRAGDLAEQDQNRKLGFITRLSALSQELMTGARLEQQREDAAAAEDQAGRTALGGALAGVSGKLLAGGLLGGDKGALGAFAPGYLEYLLGKEQSRKDAALAK